VIFRGAPIRLAPSDVSGEYDGDTAGILSGEDRVVNISTGVLSRRGGGFSCKAGRDRAIRWATMPQNRWCVKPAGWDYTVKLTVQGETGSSRPAMNFFRAGGRWRFRGEVYPNVHAERNITTEFGADATAEGGTASPG